MKQGSSIIGLNLHAKDGAIGSIDDLLFDDAHWGVRWVVVDTGNWLPGRRVLVPPSSFGAINLASRIVSVDLTRERIANAPGAETNEPVSRQLESEIYSHYDWSPYWEGGYGYPPGLAGLGSAVPPAGAIAPDMASDTTRHEPSEQFGDLSLQWRALWLRRGLDRSESGPISSIVTDAAAYDRRGYYA